MDLTGQRIGPIRIDALIGKGGMGQVYEATDRRLRRQVAVKTLRARNREDPVGRARFVREARLLSRFDHPAICRVYGLLHHEGHDLLVMELVRGRTLQEVAHELSYDQKLELAITVADALTVAHRQQVIHRDLKPDNVMLTDDGGVKILDFGIARPEDGPLLDASDEDVDDREEDVDDPGASSRDSAPTETAEFLGQWDAAELFDDFEMWEESDLQLEATLAGGGTLPAAPGASKGAPALEEDGEPISFPDPTFLTHANSTLGTLAYMSPEQASGGTLSVASDIYSFGLLLHELFTGRRAYPSGLPFLQQLARVSVGKTEPVVGVGDELGELIRQLEDRDPGRRPSAPEARDRLRAIRVAPELRRRRLTRRTLAGLALALALLAVGAVVDSRLDAARRAQVARELAREGSDIEWFLRAEHLSPHHDLRPARARVRERLDSLEERMRSLDAAGRAGGHAALGRGSLALGEVDAAADHFAQASELGIDPEEIAAVEGFALAERYRQRLLAADHVGDASHRDSLLAAARSDLLEPARAALRLAAERPDAQRRGVELLTRASLAFLDERWDEALDLASQAAEADPWFYEADLLAARVHLQQMLRAMNVAGSEEAAESAFVASRRLLGRAALVGRSDPAVHLEVCALYYESLSPVGRFHAAAVPRRLSAGLEACGLALELDPDSARAYLLIALLHARAADEALERGAAGEKDFLAGIEQSIAAAERAVALDPHDPETWRALSMPLVVRGDDLASRGQDPSALVERAVAAVQAGLEAAPRDVHLLNMLGNAHGLVVDYLASTGQDLTPALDACADAYRRGIEAADEDALVAASFPRTNLALQLGVGVRWRVDQDLDPDPWLTEGLTVAGQVVTENPANSFGWRSMAHLLTDAARWRLLEREGEVDDQVDNQVDDQIRDLTRRATSAADRAAELADNRYVSEARLRTRLLAARVALLAGEDPEPWLGDGLAESARLTDEAPDFVAGWVLRAELLDLAALRAEGAERQRWASRADDARRRVRDLANAPTEP